MDVTSLQLNFTTRTQKKLQSDKKTFCSLTKTTYGNFNLFLHNTQFYDLNDDTGVFILSVGEYQVVVLKNQCFIIQQIGYNKKHIEVEQIAKILMTEIQLNPNLSVHNIAFTTIMSRITDDFNKQYQASFQNYSMTRAEDTSFFSKQFQELLSQ